MTLQHLRSSTANKRPLPGSMSDGQIAINTNTSSPGLFFKDSAGALVKVGPVHVGSTAPNASPASGGETGNTVGEQWLDTSGTNPVLKVWDGSAWQSQSGEFVNASGDVMTGALGIIAGSASSPGLYFTGDTNTGIYSPGADQVAISTNGTGRLFVDASGNVGVGASPSGSYKLEVKAGAIDSAAIFDSTNAVGPHLRFSTSGTDRHYLGSAPGFTTGGTSSDFAIRTAGYLAFSTGGNNERMRLTSTGALGLGTSSPGATLNVRYDNAGASTVALFENQRSVAGSNDAGQIVVGARTYNNTILRQNSDQGTAAIGGALDTVLANTYSASGFGKLILATQSTPRLTIKESGEVGIGTTGPNERVDAGSGNFVTSGYYITSSNGRLRLRNSNNTNYSEIYNPETGSGASIAFTYGGGEAARIDSSGRLLVGTSSDSGGALLQVNGNRIRVATAKTPASASDTGTAGEICWDASYIYVCTATNTWKRTAISTW